MAQCKELLLVSFMLIDIPAALLESGKHIHSPRIFLSEPRLQQRINKDKKAM